MDNSKGFHLIWPILMVMLAFSFRKPELKGWIERPDYQVCASKALAGCAVDRNLSVRNALGSGRNGLKNLELVDDRTLLNRPYLFGAYPFLLRSSAVSIHDPKNIFSIGAIVFVSILMSFVLISLFQR